MSERRVFQMVVTAMANLRELKRADIGGKQRFRIWWMQTTRWNVMFR